MDIAVAAGENPAMPRHSHHDHAHPHPKGPLPTRRGFLRLLVPGSLFATRALAQQPADQAEAFRRRSEDFEAKGLAEPFKGLTANGEVAPGLFPIRSTGVSTEPVRQAAERFLSSLTAEQRARTCFPIDAPEWRKWMNQHFYVRQGVSLKEMTGASATRLSGCCSAAMSARGFELTRDIMRLNETLAELTGDREFLGEWLYYFTVMGTPSATEPWGFQLDGHHAIVNYFVLGDQVVMTPHFAGSEPVAATSGKYAGTIVLQEEQNRGLAMMQGAHRRSAEAGRAGVLQDGQQQPDRGLQGQRRSRLRRRPGPPARTGAQKKQLLDLTALFVGNMDDGHARVKMTRSSAHLDATRFAWIGGAEAEQRLLLPHPQPGDADRVRPPAAGEPAPPGAGRPR